MCHDTLWGRICTLIDCDLADAGKWWLDHQMYYHLYYDVAQLMGRSKGPFMQHVHFKLASSQ